MSDAVIGLDVGGANLKAARGGGACRSRPFALWKAPHRLADELRALLDGWSAERVAVTMTGELCDCFETKRQGVGAILDAVADVFDQRTVSVWTTAGRFISFERARIEELSCAASNWLALATFVGRYVPHGPGLMVDIGSTTTDIVPLHDGAPVPQGRTDTERMAAHELHYVGVRRTPVCAIGISRLMNEFFATTLDIDLVLGRRKDDANDDDTADGRPATRHYAMARLARMIGGDGEITPESEVAQLARDLLVMMQAGIGYRISQHQPRSAKFVVSGVGEQLAREVLELVNLGHNGIQSLAALLGADVSASACAHAVAVLLREGRHGPC